MSGPLIKAVIVDDEFPAREELRYLLEASGIVEICGEADCVEDAFRLVIQLKPDLVFLDICLGDSDGITLARELVTAGSGSLIVFTTAYNRYAVEAFELHAADYILKPFVLERVKKTLDWAQKIIHEKSTASFSAAVGLMIEEKLLGLWDKRKKSIKSLPTSRTHFT